MNSKLLKQMGKYIQKSKTFLWPLLNLNVTPVETYLKFGGFVDMGEARILIVLFHNGAEDYQENKSKIESHKLYDFTFEDGDFDIVTFNMYSFKDDFDKIMNGEYSQISPEYKMFMSLIDNNIVVQNCLAPENHYKEFAEVLDVQPHELKGEELLSPPNLEAETLFVIPEIKQQIIEEYGFS